MQTLMNRDLGRMRLMISHAARSLQGFSIESKRSSRFTCGPVTCRYQIANMVPWSRSSVFQTVQVQGLFASAGPGWVWSLL